MAGHRRVPRNTVAVPAGWFIVLSVVACVGASGWLGVMLIGPTTAAADSSRPPSLSTPSPATTSATPAPVETTPAKPKVTREAPVSILNNTGIKNLAKSFSADVEAAGWDISGLGNWRGQIASNTVYYPEDLRDQAQLLASDVGIDRVLPSIVPMRMDRLTIILSGPQQ